MKSTNTTRIGGLKTKMSGYKILEVNTTRIHLRRLCLHLESLGIAHYWDPPYPDYCNSSQPMSDLHFDHMTKARELDQSEPYNFCAIPKVNKTRSRSKASKKASWFSF